MCIPYYHGAQVKMVPESVIKDHTGSLDVECVYEGAGGIRIAQTIFILGFPNVFTFKLASLD